MKVSKEQMAQHRERIILSASRSFRTKGFDGVSVAELMKDAQLTHGGFYNHFQSKQELMLLTIERAFQETAARWQECADLSPANPLEVIVRQYLSEHHLKHPETGCIVAALGTEMSKQPPQIKAVITAGIERLLDIIQSQLPSRPSGQRQQAVAIFSQMAGAMILARSQSERSAARQVLSDSSDRLLKTIGNDKARA